MYYLIKESNANFRLSSNIGADFINLPVSYRENQADKYEMEFDNLETFDGRVIESINSFNTADSEEARRSREMIMQAQDFR